MSARSSSNQPAAAASPVTPELGPLPAPADAAARGESIRNLESFVKRYFPDRKLGDPMLRKFAEAIYVSNPELPAVDANTPAGQLYDATVLWAVLSGRRGAVLIGGHRTDAIAFIAKILDTLNTNKLLAEDFPETCLPIRHAIRMGNGGKGQLYNGVETLTEIAPERIRFARIAGLCSNRFICTGFYQPQYDLVLNPPPAA